MPPALAAPAARFTFVVGKGGVGKSTTAATLALAWAAAGRTVHLLSTDPAHSLGDVFGLQLPVGDSQSACVPELTVEEPSPGQRAEAWLARARAPLRELLERGSYLDGEDIDRFTALRLPGTDEVMAALRLVELLGSPAQHVVVDTAPTGHTLRLLEAPTLLESWTEVLHALAAKADAVATALVGGRVRAAGDELRAELQLELERFRRDVLGAAEFIVVSRAGQLVQAETERLLTTLQARGLHLRAFVHVGPGPARPNAVRVPLLKPPPRGCRDLTAAARWLMAEAAETAGEPDLRARAAGDAGPPTAAGALAPPTSPGAGGAALGSGIAWLTARPERLLMLAGKGGVGKSTCAAAAAVVLGRTRPVLLLGTDPAGSLGDVLAQDVTDTPRPVAPGVRAVQLDAATALARWRGTLRAETAPVFQRLGLGGDPALDRRVFESIWNLAPPGMDELVALTALLDAVAEGETVVLDTAPTGHFLRLLELPGMAQEWTRAVMRILLKYGVAGELDALTQAVIAFARQLKELRSRLADAGWTGALVVTMAEPVVEAETARLVTSLAEAGIPLSAILTNRLTAPPPPRPRDQPAPRLGAPLLAQPPRGVDELLRFAAQWEVQ